MNQETRNPNDDILIRVRPPQEEDKERRGAGVVLASAPARVGAGLPASPWLPGARWMADAVANALGTASPAGALFASKAGAPMVLAGILGWGGLMSAAALKLAGGEAAAPKPALFLPAPARELVIDAPKNYSLPAAASVNSGQLAWGEGEPSALRDAPSGAAPAAGTAEASPLPVPELPLPPEPEPSGLKAAGRALSGLGSSRSMAGESARMASAGPDFSSGRQGSERRLAGSPGGFALKQSFSSAGVLGGKGSRLRPFGRRSANASRAAAGRSSPRAASGRAIGQLRYARTLSASAAGAAPEAHARQFSSDAFDQATTLKPSGADFAPASAIASPPASGGAVAPLGSGAPETVPGPEPLPDPVAPPVGPSSNVTPYQDDVDSSQSKGNTAGMLKALAVALLAAGALLLLLSTMIPCPACKIVAAIGMALIAAGMMTMMMAQQQADQAKSDADKIGQSDGQREQNSTASSCVDMAYAQGRTVDEVCPGGRPPLDTGRASGVDVQSAVKSQGPQVP